MKILSVAWKDMLILLKDRNNMIFTFLLPVIFVVVYLGVAASGSGGAETNEESERIPLPVINGDPEGELSNMLLENLDRYGGLQTSVVDEAQAMADLEDEKMARVLIIPAGYSADLAAGEQVRLRLVHNSLDRGQNETVFLAVEGVTRDMALEQQIVASLEQMAAMQASDPGFDARTSANLAVPLARAQFASSRDRPLIAVHQQPASSGNKPVEISGVQLAVPGFAVLFVFLTAQTTARSIYEEKKIGSFRRLLAAPISNAELLAGKLLPNFIIVILQVMLVFAAGIFLLPLMGMPRLSLGEAPLALAVLVVVVALCSTTLGILIAAQAKTEAQIGGISAVILWVLAFLGGCFLPLFLINETMAAIGQVTPHYWAVTGFYDLLTRGLGFAAIIDSLLALLGFTGIFLIVGLWRFDFD